MSFKALSKSLSVLQGGNHRLLAVCARKFPDTESDFHRHRPTVLFAFCPFELSNAALIISSAPILGDPAPHALYWRA